MRTFSDRLIGHAFQCFINLIFLYGQDHAVCYSWTCVRRGWYSGSTRDGVDFSLFIPCPQISAGEIGMYVLRSS